MSPQHIFEDFRKLVWFHFFLLAWKVECKTRISSVIYFLPKPMYTYVTEWLQNITKKRVQIHIVNFSTKSNILRHFILLAHFSLRIKRSPATSTTRNFYRILSSFFLTIIDGS